MPLDYGAISGLATDFGADERIADLRYQNQMKRQAQIASEAKAKMLADDFNFSNAMNAWDHENVKQYAQGKIKEIGKWIRENPDYLYNVEKRGLYNQMTRELKDNQHLNTGMQVDANIKDYQKWMQEHPELRDMPESATLKEQLSNYLKTGSTDGITANRKLFQFATPESPYDFNTLLEQYGKKVPKTLKGKSYLASGLMQLQYGSTDNDVKNAAQAYLSNLNPHQAKWWNYNYGAKLKENNLDPNKYTLLDYTKDTLDGHVSPDEFERATYHVNDKAAGNGKKNPYSTEDSLLSRVLAKSYQEPGKQIQFTPGSAEKIYVGKNGVLNSDLGKMFIRDTQGNIKDVRDFKGGSTKNWDFSGTTLSSVPVIDPVTKKKEFATYVTGKVTMPYEQFNKVMGEDIAEDQDWFGKNIGINTKFRDMPVKIVNNEDGKPEAVEVELNFPVEANNPQVHYVSDQGAGTKQLQYGFGAEEGVQVIDIKEHNGKKYYKLSTGDIVDEQGNKY